MYMSDKDWFEEGLRELGLSVAEYNKLSAPEKRAIKELLQECGHIC